MYETYLYFIYIVVKTYLYFLRFEVFHECSRSILHCVALPEIERNELYSGQLLNRLVRPK